MPFHTRLLGADRMALYSFIHSLNTSFGTAIYETIAQQIALDNFAVVKRGHKLNQVISAAAQAEIVEIVNSLNSGEIEPDHDDEIHRIRACCKSGGDIQKKLVNVDLFLETDAGCYLFDIKTAKPNLTGFESHKQKLLEWTASVLRQNDAANVNAAIAIPYNPYFPAPYKRWTLRGMLDLDAQLFVGADFWNFLAGGDDIFEALLDCFEQVGIRMKDEIDERIGERVKQSGHYKSIS